jgi:FKBP-type peptidyl-prolyl cis-trans isomerase FklB
MQTKSVLFLLAGGLALASCQTSTHGEFSGTFNNDVDSVSYALGLSVGSNVKQSGLENLNISAIAEGFAHSMGDGSNALMSEEDANTFLQKYFTELNRKKVEKETAGKREEGEKFLAENAQREGVTVTESGLQYEVITMGTGEKPTAESIVKVHYHGTLVDGSVFDSSVDRGEPAQFPLNQVIRGWTEALQLMPVGSKFKIVLPYSLAYGEQGAGGMIAPYSTLIFEVELLEIVDAQQ